MSVDGDADRLIYFYKNQDGDLFFSFLFPLPFSLSFSCLDTLSVFSSGHIKILDGDKILCLFVHFLGALLESGFSFLMKEKAFFFLQY